jgi:hypothetical protein
LSSTPSHRFIANNLLVEVTSTKALARIFTLALKRQMFISFFLYCAGSFIALLLKMLDLNTKHAEI